MSEPEEFELFRQCVGLSAEEREAFIAERCTGNAGLERLLRQLLAAHERNKDSADLDLEKATSVDREHPLPAGGVVGSYQLLENLGVGSHGAVFTARSPDATGDIVAVKLLRFYHQNEAGRARFGNEIAALKALEHRGIASLIDSGTLEDGSPYLVMEHAKGEPLSASFVESMSIEDRLELFLQVAGAIAYAHEKLILHRDLKPGNVIASIGNPAVVTDFGLAKLLDASAASLTNSDHVLGSIGYMAPEQVLSGKHHDVRTDVYGLGALLYFILTGKPPFASKDYHSFAKQVIEAEPTEPRKLNSNVPIDLSKICCQCLRKAPTDRYQTVRELIADVHKHQDGLPVSARPVPALMRFRYWAARNQLAAGLLATTAASVVGLIVLLWILLRVSGQELNTSQRYARKLEESASRYRRTIKDLTSEISSIDNDPEELIQRRNLLAAVCDLYHYLLEDGVTDIDTLYRSAVASFNLGRAEQRLGHYNAKTLAFETAFARFAEVLRRDPTRTEADFDLFHCERRLSRHRDALSRIKRLSNSGRTDELILLDGYANQLGIEAQELMREKRFDLAQAACDEGEAIYRRLVKEHGRDSLYLRHVATHQFRKAEIAINLGELSQAEDLIHRAVDDQQEFLSHHQSQANFYNEMHRYQTMSAELLALRGKFAEAISRMQDAEQTVLAMHERFRYNEESWRLLPVAKSGQYCLAELTGDQDRAEELYAEYLRLLEQQVEFQKTRKARLRLLVACLHPEWGNRSRAEELLGILSLSTPHHELDIQELQAQSTALLMLGRIRQARLGFEAFAKRWPRPVVLLDVCRALEAGTHEAIIREIEAREYVWPDLYPNSIIAELHRRTDIRKQVNAALAARKAAQE